MSKNICRILLQQCLSADLKLPTQENGGEPPCVKIERGILVYVSFLSGASEQHLDKIVKAILNVRLCEDEKGSLVSIQTVKGDILVIPQACLAGKLKGLSVQHHGLASKEEGAQLFLTLVNKLSHNTECSVKCGVYGARQVLSVQTNGPFSHILDF